MTWGYILQDFAGFCSIFFLFLACGDLSGVGDESSPSLDSVGPSQKEDSWVFKVSRGLSTLQAQPGPWVTGHNLCWAERRRCEL